MKAFVVYYKVEGKIANYLFTGRTSLNVRREFHQKYPDLFIIKVVEL